jgi:outer membrane biosynthesis protein TonB
MHAPSALLTGVVLTFGATALANLYLPSAVAVSAPATGAYRGAVSVPQEAFEEPIFASVDEPNTEPIVQEILRGTAEPMVAEAAAPPAPVAKKAEEPTKKAAKPAATKKEVPRTASTSQKKEAPKAAPSTQATPLLASRAFGKTVPARPEAQQSNVSVSAISGDRAWVRIGDRRTLVVRAGDIVPTVGRVKSITVDGVVLDNGEVLKVSQSATQP